MAASYPTSDPSFTTKTDAVDDVQAAHVNALQDEVIAIGAALRGTCDHDVHLAAAHHFYEAGRTAALGEWTTYSPTWASVSAPQPAIGDGTLSGRWMQIDHTVFYEIRLAAGSTTTYGTGSYTFTLPSTAADANSGGGCRVYDANTGTWYIGEVYMASTSTVTGVTHGATASLTPTVPITFAASDGILLHGWYTVS